jgi:SAM-dependent methyltransferase
MEKEFNKYDYYLRAVQSADVDAEFLNRVFTEVKGKAPQSLREDFCGTFALCQEWVKLNSKYTAVGVDLDPEPIAYGQNLMNSTLSAGQKERVKVLTQDVFDISAPSTDLVVALNFSFFIIKEREKLRRYFANVFEKLNTGGVFIIDCFGGSQCFESIEEETNHGDFLYFWDQEGFDPISANAQFYIHFQIKGQEKREKVFSYDWRMWSIPELREILSEAGFSKSTVYWEGTTEEGEGDGEFHPVTVGEDCESWIAYIAAEK